MKLNFCAVMSCLFDSLAEALEAMLGKKKVDVRNIIVNYMRLNQEEIIADDSLRSWLELYTVVESHKDIDAYLDKMSHKSTWGGEPEIAVFCRIFNLCVIVKDLRSKTKYVYNEKENNLIIYLNYTGSHYTYHKFEERL